MSNLLKELVKTVQFKLGINQEDVADKVGYSRPYFNALIKKNDRDAIDKMYLKFPDILQNVRIEHEGTSGDLPNAIPVDETSSKEKGTDQPQLGINDSNDIREKSLDAIIGLIEIGKVIADNNTELTSMLKDNFTTGKTIHGIPEVLLAKFAEILAFVAEVGVGKNWDSVERGSEILHKRFFGTEPVKKEVGSHDAESK